MLGKVITVFLKLFFSLLKFVFVYLYKLFYLIRKLKKIIFPSEKIKPVYIFINQYISHIIIIALVFIICFANVLTSETKAESYGEKSILFALATGSNIGEEYIEEGIEAEGATIKSYLGTKESAVSEIALQPTFEETTPSIFSEGAAVVKPEIPSLEAAKPKRDIIIEYAVQAGDTISTIAEKFGVSQNTILWENKLSARSFIRPGQILNILPTNGITYKIAKGDTLTKIAQKYKSEVSKILEFNRLADESDIQIGQSIIIPEGQPYYAPVPVAPKLATIDKIFQPTHVDVPSGDKMAWPTTARRISQYFNWRHIGLDIDGEFGDPIWAAENGVITKSVCQKTGYGCHVIIDHGNGKTTLYAHFQKLYVKEGQSVIRGDVLGEMGSTGYSTGSHLHFEVRFGGKRYNPLSYIK